MSRTRSPKTVAEPPGGPLLPVAGLDYGVLDDLLGYALRRAQIALYVDFYRATAGLDVSPPRFAALVLVGRNPGMRQGLLAQAMGLHAALLKLDLERLAAMAAANNNDVGDKR